MARGWWPNAVHANEVHGKDDGTRLQAIIETDSERYCRPSAGRVNSAKTVRVGATVDKVSHSAVFRCMFTILLMLVVTDCYLILHLFFLLRVGHLRTLFCLHMSHRNVVFVTLA